MTKKFKVIIWTADRRCLTEEIEEVMVYDSEEENIKRIIRSYMSSNYVILNTENGPIGVNRDYIISVKVNPIED